MDVVLVKKHQTDSYNVPPPRVVAVATNEKVARRWIQNEVDGLHNSGTRYASRMSVDEWIRYGTFSLETVAVIT